MGNSSPNRTDDEPPRTANEPSQQESTNYWQQRYQLVMEETGATLFEWNLLDGSFECSDSFYKYEFSKVDPSAVLTNSGPLDTVHPDDLPLLFRFFQDTETKPKATVNLRLKMTDGTYRQSRMTGIFPQEEDGQRIRVIGVIIDIEEETQKAIVEESLLDAIPGGVAIFRIMDAEPFLECQYFSDGFARMSNRTREELDELLRAKTPLTDVVLPADRERFISEWREKSKTGEPINLMYRCRTKEGHVYWTHVSATHIREDDGCPVYYAVFSEPSTETLLYRTLMEESSIATIVAEKSNRRILFVNPAWKKLEGIDVDRKVIGKMLPPLIREDRHIFTEAQTRDLPTDHLQTYHIRQEDGRCLFVQGRSIRWNERDAYILFIINETDQVLQNERLESSRALLDAAMKNANVSAWELDIEKRQITQTPLSQVIHGFNLVVPNVPETLLQNSSISPATSGELKRLYEEVYQGKSSQADIQFRDPNTGKYFWERIFYKPVFNDNGKLVRAIGTSLNIEKEMERKQRYDEQMKLSRAVARASVATVYINLTTGAVSEMHSDNPDILAALQSGTADQIHHAMSLLIPKGKGRDDFNRLHGPDAMRKAYRRGETGGSICHTFTVLPGWFESSYSFMQNPDTDEVDAVCITRDVSAEKQAELVINTLIDVDYDRIFTLDVHSGEARPLLLYKYEGLNRKDQSENIADELRSYPGDEEYTQRVTRENSTAYIQQQLKSKQLYTTDFFVQREGKTFRKRAMYCYLNEDRRTILGTVQDYTKSYEKEEHLQRILEKALDDAKSANRAKSDYLSNMSHEIRTPMNAIIGMTKLAEDAVLEDDASATEYLKQIDSSSEYLLGILNDILDMSRIENNKFKLVPQWIDGREAVRSCITMVEPLMAKKNIAFIHPKLNVPSQDFELYMDKLRVKQILMNLLNNAAKFTQDGGRVELEIRNISCTDDSCTDEIIVRDNGCGMSREFLTHVFETFSQERNEFSDKVQGTGLGLALTRKIVEAMGGTIRIESELNQGTTVFVRLPYKCRPCEKHDDSRKPHSFDKAILAGKQVLLCEDQPLNSIIAGKLLEKQGMKVDIATNGYEGLKTFLSKPEFTYAAVLMDIRMPVMNGLEAARKIRSLNRKDARTIPIIAMTANAFEEDKQASYDAGMNAHLFKPVQPEALYETLAKLIDARTKKK